MIAIDTDAARNNTLNAVQVQLYVTDLSRNNFENPMLERTARPRKTDWTTTGVLTGFAEYIMR